MSRAKKSDKKSIEQYDHKGKERVNNPPVGLVTPETDRESGKKSYAYDPHLDPQLVWAGKAEHTSFEVPTVSLHVHERIDPRTIIEAVRKRNGKQPEQLSLFDSPEENPPLREAIEFYKHKHNWFNRLIAGDSLLVMNSLLEKEGMAGEVQMIYIDPPYGIKYGSNFQPFVNKRDVKDGKDEDLTAEPEMIKAFRDTWELGIHSYLTYLRDRLLLARELLTESGSIFVQISDENVHLVRCLMDEVFGVGNFVSEIIFTKTRSLVSSDFLTTISDFILWYAKDRESAKAMMRKLYEMRSGDELASHYEDTDGKIYSRGEAQELLQNNPDLRLRAFKSDDLVRKSNPIFKVEFEGKIYESGYRTSPEGMQRLIAKKRIFATANQLRYKFYLDDFPASPLNSLWTDTIGARNPVYVVQTNEKIIQRCLLMTTDPGDLVFDPTCGSGTTAYVAEQWGRRWITCDTSRVAITLAKQRLMTASYDYYELAHPEEGVGSGFKYKTVPHITLKSIANNEPPAQETLYDQPYIDNKKARVSGPFTVEAVPAPAVKEIDSDEWRVESGEKKLTTRHSPLFTMSIARSSETLRQSEWRDEIFRTGIRGKRGQRIEFSRVEPLPGTRWLHAEAETKPNDLGADSVREDRAVFGQPQRAVISFGPEYAPLEQRQVALAIEEAQSLVPKPKIIIFASFQFDPEASKDIDETDWPGVTLLKAQMNADLLTDDLKKKRAGNESFWLIGQPDVKVTSGEWIVDSKNQIGGSYEHIKILSGANSLAEVNRIDSKDLLLYAAISQRRDLWAGFTDEKGGSFDSLQYSGRSGAKDNGRIRSVSGHIEGVLGRIGDLAGNIKTNEFSKGGALSGFIKRLRGDKQIAQWLNQITFHSPLTTRHYVQVEVQGFDYYNTKTGNIESGGTQQIAMWMLDTDYDGRSLFPDQVFFPMAGPKEGWSRLTRNLKAEIDEELIEAYRGTISLPFEPGEHRRIAVKIVDDRGIESLKIVEVV